MGMYRKHIQEALGHSAHRGWARLFLDRARVLIIHGPAHRGANGAAMPTNEGDQDGHFFYNHPERGGGATSLPQVPHAQPPALWSWRYRLGARSLCCRCLDRIPKKKT